MSSEPKLNAEQICLNASHRISFFLYPAESFDLSRDESKAYFVFRFTVRDRDSVREIASLSVLGAMIEDGIISEQSLHASLWQELGRIRGML
jgi:hypothetical protein